MHTAGYLNTKNNMHDSVSSVIYFPDHRSQMALISWILIALGMCAGTLHIKYRNIEKNYYNSCNFVMYAGF